MKSFSRGLLVLAAVLFAGGCDDTENGDGMMAPAVRAKISVDIPPSLVEENTATLMVSWVGEVQKGVVSVRSASGGRLVAYHEFQTADYPNQQMALEVEYMFSGTEHNVEVLATDKSGGAVVDRATFRTAMLGEVQISNIRLEKYMNTDAVVFDLNKKASWAVLISDLTASGGFQIVQKGESAGVIMVPLNLVGGHDYLLQISAWTYGDLKAKTEELALGVWEPVP